MGLDLTGGWYDAGDHVKFNFPMAWSATTLIWGLLEYRDAWQKSGEWQNGLDCVKWPLDYLIKCHPDENRYFVQVRALAFMSCMHTYAPIEFGSNMLLPPNHTHIHIYNPGGQR